MSKQYLLMGLVKGELPFSHLSFLAGFAEEGGASGVDTAG